MSCPPRIGTPEWDRELDGLGPDRRNVDDELRSALEVTPGEIDPHGLEFGGGPETTAAAWVLLHQDAPSYAVLMYLHRCWRSADEALRAWIVRQLAAMLLHGPRPVAESAEYGLWVDHFEGPDASRVFADLAAQLPHSGRDRLLAAAGPVPWAAKREVFAEAAGTPALHTALAKGISGSFYDVYGDVDAVEAAVLLDRITVADEDLQEALVEVTTEPLRLRSGSAIVLADENGFLLRAAIRSTRSRWIPRSELVADGEVLGRLVHWDHPFDPSAGHRTVPAPEPDGHVVLFRVEGAPEHAALVVNRDLEAWPPGLREHRARS